MYFVIYPYKKPLQSAGGFVFDERNILAVAKKGKSATCQGHTSRRKCIAFAKGKNIATSLV